MSFFAHLLRCADTTYHAGHTDCLDSRIAQHESGECGGYTATLRPVALATEQHIKGWSRAKKEALIARDWKRIQQLAWSTKNPLPEHLR